MEFLAISAALPTQVTASTPDLVEIRAANAEPDTVPESVVESPASALESLNQTAQTRSTALEFAFDASTHTQVVVVKDSDTGDVLIQFPSEDALRMARNLAAGIGGLVDTKA